MNWNDMVIEFIVLLMLMAIAVIMFTNGGVHV